jgi:hypothetical protein
LNSTSRSGSSRSYLTTVCPCHHGNSRFILQPKASNHCDRFQVWPQFVRRLLLAALTHRCVVCEVPHSVIQDFGSRGTQSSLKCTCFFPQSFQVNTGLSDCQPQYPLANLTPWRSDCS